MLAHLPVKTKKIKIHPPRYFNVGTCGSRHSRGLFLFNVEITTWFYSHDNMVTFDMLDN